MNPLTASRRGITLVELLIVISIVTLLTAVALPNIRDQLKDQKSKRSADLVRSYINKARARAISSGRPYGVVLRRAGSANVYDRSRCIEISYARMSRAYSGDADNAIVRRTPAAVSLRHGFTFDFFDFFDVAGNPTPPLVGNVNSMTIAQVPAAETYGYSGGRNVWKKHPFIQSGDLVVPFNSNSQWEVIRGANRVISGIHNTELDLQREDLSRNVDIAVTNPSPPAPATPSFDQRTYKIYRYIRTSSVPLQLPRGAVIDLAFSGYGNGAQFSPMEMSTLGYDPSAAQNPVFRSEVIDFEDIWIMFGPSGELESVLCGQEMWDSLAAPAAPLADANGNRVYRRDRRIVNSDIYLLVGRDGSTDPFDPLSNDPKNLSNLFDPDSKSIWVTINGSSGEVGTKPVNPLTPPTTTVPLANMFDTLRSYVWESRTTIPTDQRRP